MNIENLISNGGFESGNFPPWVITGGAIENTVANTGFYSAKLNGGNSSSVLSQVIPVVPNTNFQFLLSVAKTENQPNPPVALFVEYYDASLNFITYGYVQGLLYNSLPLASQGTWKYVNAITESVPSSGVYAIVRIETLPQPNSSPIVVDDVSLIMNVGGGSGNLSFEMIFPLILTRLTPLIGRQVKVFNGILYSIGTLTEVTNEYIVVVDTNGIKDVFPINTVSVVEYS